MNHQFSGHPVDIPVSVRWLNPVGYPTWNEPIGQLLHAIKQPSTEIEVVSFDMNPSPTHLEYRTYEALIDERTVAVARDSGQKNIDALVVGCFYDPAIEAAREISGRTVVIGPCQASVQIATQLANRFSVVVGREKWIEQMKDRIRGYGQIDRLASMRSLGMGVNDFQAQPEVTRRRIIEEARRAVDEDKAEAVILGCTIEFGFFDAVQQAVGVPVIDPVVAAFKMAESFARLKKQFGWAPSRVWSCEPPPESELDDFGLFRGPVPIGHTVTF
ncbi:aspartate/glutamate racemase family protein [Paraburkholderia sediminicola]|uniref:aspartate/glutamate racemase family protein n=1 Tax=Paraburkholderia sediminicola TaxID=458836 RepID=UPI0038B715F9